MTRSENHKFASCNEMTDLGKITQYMPEPVGESRRREIYIGETRLTPSKHINQASHH